MPTTTPTPPPPCFPCQAKVILDSDSVAAAATGLAAQVEAVCESALRLLDGGLPYAELSPLMEYLCDDALPAVQAIGAKAHDMLLLIIKRHLPATSGS